MSRQEEDDLIPDFNDQYDHRKDKTAEVELDLFLTIPQKIPGLQCLAVQGLRTQGRTP